MNRTTLTLLMATALVLGACGESEDPVASDGVDRSAGSTEPSSESPLAPPDEPPGIEGPIDTVTPGGVASDCEAVTGSDPDDAVSSDESQPECTSEPTGDTGTVLIAPGTGEGSWDAALISVTPDTQLLVADGEDGWERGSFDELEPGVEIRVWVAGDAVAESYPVQFGADVLTYEPAGSTPSSSIPTTSAPATTHPDDTGATVTPPSTEPTTVGTVDGVAGGYCIVGGADEECPTSAVGSVRVAAEGRSVDLIATVTADTVILAGDGTGGWKAVDLDAVQGGAPVRVWVVGGALTKSIPARGTAETIVLDG